MEGYWSKVTSSRLTRRRALQGAAALGVGAASLSLIGCGDGGDDSTGVKGDASGLLSAKADSTKQAVAGGTWSSYRDEDLISTNPLSNPQGAAQSELGWAYGLLTKHAFAVGRPVGADEMTGDVAESWEISPDGQQVTLKVRSGLKFHNIPPVNGRAVSSSDVKFSYDTAAQTSPYRANMFYSASKAAPIESVTTPDDRTVVLKLAFPYGPIIEALGHHQHPYIVPKEAEGGFNANAAMIGSGPYMLTTYQQSSRLEYTKNPDYYVKGRPFVDKVTKPIITDYAAGLAQFETKAISDFTVKPEDILRVKRDHPEMLMWTEPRPSGYISQKIYNFSKQPNSAVADVRIRRAFSMTIDRDLYIDTMENTVVFEKEGIPVETGWNGPLAAFFPSWIDPRNEKEFGEAAKFYKYDPAEAKKLLQAAGQTRVNFPWGYYTDRGTEHTKINEIVVGMAEETGLFKITLEPLPYASTGATSVSSATARASPAPATTAPTASTRTRTW